MPSITHDSGEIHITVEYDPKEDDLHIFLDFEGETLELTMDKKSGENLVQAIKSVIE